MGWWRAGSDGSSLHAEETGLVWGDGPADILDDAIDKISAEFRAAYDRSPSRAELEAGLLFSLGAYEEPERTEPDAVVPEGEDPLSWLKACIQGYDYLMADPEVGLATWHEARDRGMRRIRAACRVIASAIREG